MRKIAFSFLILITAVLSIAVLAGVSKPPDEIADFESLTPSERHEIMAAMKARSLENARQFAATVMKTESFYDQTDYDVNFYQVEIKVDIPAETIYGNVLMEAKAAVDGLDTIEVDLYSNMTVDSVYTESALLNYNHLSDKLLIELDGQYNADETFSLSIRYHGSPIETGLAGFSFDERYGHPVVSTLSEPMSARSWWPCKDRPDDKADSMDMIITCDTALFCASNGILVDTVRNGDGTWDFSYQVRYPITTYLFSLTISKYAVWHDWYHYGENDSMIVINYVYPDKYSYSLTHYNITPYAIGVFAGLFGEYPFINEKYGHANFQWRGGMEHQTVSSMYGSADYGFSEPLIVHELSHQWFGDMITCNNWHEIWLNEGFASYCEALYYEVKNGTAAYHNYMAGMRYEGGGTIYVSDTTSAWNIFSLIVYDKGAWVLHMLRHVVGDDIFFDIMQAYYGSEHQYGDATTEDFKNVCETVSGVELDGFFDQWIYGTYFPRYYRSYISEMDPNDGKYWTYFYLRQAQSSPPQVFEMPVDLVFTYDAADPDTVTLLNDVRDSVYIFKTDQPPVDIAVDPEEWILKQSFFSDWSYHLLSLIHI